MSHNDRSDQHRGGHHNANELENPVQNPGPCAGSGRVRAGVVGSKNGWIVVAARSDSRMVSDAPEQQVGGDQQTQPYRCQAQGQQESGVK